MNAVTVPLNNTGGSTADTSSGPSAFCPPGLRPAAPSPAARSWQRLASDLRHVRPLLPHTPHPAKTAARVQLFVAQLRAGTAWRERPLTGHRVRNGQSLLEGSSAEWRGAEEGQARHCERGKSKEASWRVWLLKGPAWRVLTRKMARVARNSLPRRRALVGTERVGGTLHLRSAPGRPGGPREPGPGSLVGARRQQRALGGRRRLCWQRGPWEPPSWAAARPEPPLRSPTVQPTGAEGANPLSHRHRCPAACTQHASRVCLLHLSPNTR